MSTSLPNIQVTTVDGPDGVEVVVGGEIDLETSPILEAVLASAVERSSTDLRRAWPRSSASTRRALARGTKRCSRPRQHDLRRTW